MAEKYVIVGGGEAGVAAAAAIRTAAEGAQIKLVTDERGLPYERPPLSKDVLLGEPVPTLLRAPEWYHDNRIEIVRGRASVIDPSERTMAIHQPDQKEQVLVYDQLLIATGASARRLPFPDVFYLRTWDDALAIRSRLQTHGKVVVIGGGVIGLEVASSANALGHDVVVCELADRLMARAIAPEVSAWLCDRHVRAGIDIRLGTSVHSVEERGGSYALRLSDGEVLVADLIVAGIGAAPETDLAMTAGCEIDDGILVDEAGRTSIEGIFAAGDSARFFHPGIGRHIRLEAWQHAGRHGAHVGAVMAGGIDAYRCTPWFWTDQHGINLQVAGFAATADRTIWRGDGAKRTAFHFVGERLVAASTIDNGRDIRPAIQLIEAGWTGDPAVFGDHAVPLRSVAQSWRDRLRAET